MGQSEIAALFPPLNRLKKCSRIIGRGLENRGRLAALELDEAVDRLTQTALTIAAGVIVSIIAGVAVNLLVAAIFWDTQYRVAALATLVALEIAALVVVGWQAGRKLKRWTFLEATREQLNHDRELIARLIDEHKSDDES